MHSQVVPFFSQYLLSSPRKITESFRADFFSLPSFTSFCFSALICSSSSCAVPSSAICGTSFPCIASWRIDFLRDAFIFKSRISFLFWNVPYLSIRGIIFSILNSATVSINRLLDSKLSLWCLEALFECCISRDKPFHPLTPPSDLRQYAVENRQEI